MKISEKEIDQFEDYTTQYLWDYKNPKGESARTTKQDSMECERDFEHCSVVVGARVFREIP